MSTEEAQNNDSFEDIGLVTENPSQSENQGEIDIDKHSTPGQFAQFLWQQKVLLEKFDKLIEKIDKGKKKDFWDAISSLSGFFTLLSSIVIAWLGVQFTDAYKRQEVRIAEAQTIEKFLPYLTNNNESDIRGALLAVHALQNNELASRLAASYVTKGSIEACEVILRDAKGESASRLTDALIDAYNQRAYDRYFDRSSTLEQVLSDYNRIFELRQDDYISQKWGDWYLAAVYTNRANCYRDKKDDVNAGADYEKAFQIVLNNGYAYMGLAIMHANRNDFDTAIFYHNKSIENFSHYAEVFTRRGETYEKMGRIDEAISDFNKSIDTEPNNDWIYLQRALFYQRQKEANKAEQDFKEVLELTSNESFRFQAKQALRRMRRRYQQNESRTLDEQTDDQKQNLNVR